MLYSLAPKTSEPQDSVDFIFGVTPYYLTHIDQPGLNRKIKAKLGFHLLKKILTSQQKLIYATPSSQSSEGTSGIIKLMIEPLVQGSSSENNATVLTEGSWEKAILSPIMPQFTISADERWVSQRQNTDTAKTNRWISLENDAVFTEEISSDSFSIRQVYTPATDRMLTSDITNLNLASQFGYDLLPVPVLKDLDRPIRSEDITLLPDNCRLILQKPETNDYFISECDRPLTELWWNPSLAGQGISTQQRGDRIQATWFLYDENGHPLWLDFSGKIVDNQLTAPLSQFTGPGLGSNWDNSIVDNKVVGSATLTLGDDPQTATVQYTINGTESTIQLEAFYAGSANVYNSYWWDPKTNGRGMRLYRKGNDLFGIAFLFDESGKDVWFSFQGQRSGDHFEAALDRTTGPKLGEPWDLNLLTYKTVGKIKLQFDKSNRIDAQLMVNDLEITWDLQPFRF